ncbi:MAG: sulfotransferase domain-containing protein [Bacteroidota bacterium]
MQPTFIISHRRSGTHLTIDTIRNNFPGFGEVPLLTDQKILVDPIRLEGFENLDRWQSAGRGIVKTHFLPELTEYYPTDQSPEKGEEGKHPYYLPQFKAFLEKGKKIYVVRDGRDVMVSLYRYLQSFEASYQDIDFSDFLRTMNHFGPASTEKENRMEFWKNHVKQWLGRKDVLILKFEELIINYEGAVEQISQYLGLKPLNPLVDVRLNKQSTFKRLSNRLFPDRQKRSIQRTQVQFHSAEIGVYRRFFTEKDLQLFEHHAGEALRLLNYDQ